MYEPTYITGKNDGREDTTFTTAEIIMKNGESDGKNRTLHRTNIRAG
jgi:hypothetical protein